MKGRTTEIMPNDTRDITEIVLVEMSLNRTLQLNPLKNKTLIIKI
jgi:hypothetical protein